MLWIRTTLNIAVLFKVFNTAVFLFFLVSIVAPTLAKVFYQVLPAIFWSTLATDSELRACMQNTRCIWCQSHSTKISKPMLWMTKFLRLKQFSICRLHPPYCFSCVLSIMADTWACRFCYKGVTPDDFEAMTLSTFRTSTATDSRLQSLCGFFLRSMFVSTSQRR